MSVLESRTSAGVKVGDRSTALSSGFLLWTSNKDCLRSLRSPKTSWIARVEQRGTVAAATVNSCSFILVDIYSYTWKK